MCRDLAAFRAVLLPPDVAGTWRTRRHPLTQILTLPLLCLTHSRTPATALASALSIGKSEVRNMHATKLSS